MDVRVEIKGRSESLREADRTGRGIFDTSGRGFSDVIALDLFDYDCMETSFGT